MIRKLLQEKGIVMTDKEFAEIMKVTTDDIKGNNLVVKTKTNLGYLLDVSMTYYNIMVRYKSA